MGDPKLAAFLEACHDGPDDLPSWSTGILDTLQPLAGQKSGVAIGVAKRSPLSFAGLGGRGRAEDLIARSIPAMARSWSERSFDIMFRPFRVRSSREHATGTGFDAAAAIEQGYPGCFDVIGMLGDLGTQKLIVLLPVRDASELPSRRRLLSLQRHVSGAAQRRMCPAWSDRAGLIMSGTGSVVAAKGVGTKLLPHAADIATALARDLRSGPEGDADAERLWDELWRGGWSVAHVREIDGRRLLVIRRTNPHERPPLTPRERKVLLLARQGMALKNIAAELGTTVATVSAQLSEGLRKLGLQDRAQLLALAAGARSAAR